MENKVCVIGSNCCNGYECRVCGIEIHEDMATEYCKISDTAWCASNCGSSMGEPSNPPKVIIKEIVHCHWCSIDFAKIKSQTITACNRITITMLLCILVGYIISLF